MQGKLLEWSNGTRLPNWVWIAFGLIGLGFQAGIYVSTQNATREAFSSSLDRIALMDSIRTERLVHEIKTVDLKVERRTNQVNEELKQIQRVTRYIARRIE